MKDGHIHTPFCPHGSKDSFEDYIEEAIRLGRTEISFTEHFPLPELPDQKLSRSFAARCSLARETVMNYLIAVSDMKEKYKGKIQINRGFEIDYVEKCEDQIRTLLEVYGPMIEDSLLSTHFVYYQDKYYAIDNEMEVERLLEVIPSTEMIYELYYKTLLKSIKADLGPYKPKRIGHPGLVTIFQHKWLSSYKNEALLEEIAREMKQGGYNFDLNVAGLRKPYCKSTYPSGKLLELFKQYEIPFTYGSDSHEAKQMQYIEKYGNS